MKSVKVCMGLGLGITICYVLWLTQTHTDNRIQNPYSSCTNVKSAIVMHRSRSMYVCSETELKITTNFLVFVSMRSSSASHNRSIQFCHHLQSTGISATYTTRVFLCISLLLRFEMSATKFSVKTLTIYRIPMVNERTIGYISHKLNGLTKKA